MNAKINQGPRLVIISPGYNCGKFIDLWWNSMKVQNYTNWICIAIDDISTDDTYTKLMNIATIDPRLTVVRNLKKKYQLKNWYDVIHHEIEDCIWFNQDQEFPVIDDEDIIVFHDPDDWFGTKYAFELTIKEYIHRDIWCTTARNFQLSDYYHHDAKLFVDRKDLLKLTVHEYSLSTYKARLFRGIPKHHFIDPDTGEWLQVCGDMAITMPILYQAGPEHHQHMFVDQFVIYNDVRPECDSNRVESNGKSTHSITWPKLIKSFRSMVQNNELVYSDVPPRSKTLKVDK